MLSEKYSFQIFIVFILLAFVSTAVIPNCPLTHNSCKCDLQAPFFSVRCVSPETNILANISDNIALLELSELNRSRVPLELFQSDLLHTLIVGNSSLESFNDARETRNLTLTNIRHLALENVTFSQAPEWEEFGSLKSLKVLFLHNTTIKPVLGHNFSHYFSESLESITISKCNITDVAEDSFKELLNLKSLRISHNDLKTFSKDAISKPSKLEQMRLDYNKIHSLPPGVFDDMPLLKTVSLSNNTLSTLPEEVFAPLWKPDMHLELRGNPIKCDCRIQWIVTSPTRPRDIVGQCTHPKKLFGRNLKDINEKDFNCG